MRRWVRAAGAKAATGQQFTLLVLAHRETGKEVQVRLAGDCCLLQLSQTSTGASKQFQKQ